MNILSRQYKSLLLLLPLIMIFAVTSCNDRRFCPGGIVIENEIPDTILYVGGEPFLRDAFEPPPVFRHTGGVSMSLTVVPENGSIVSANRVSNDENGELTVIKVVPERAGTTRVIVIASDGCTFNETETSFQVTVRDTTNQS